jgi:integrase
MKHLRILGQPGLFDDFCEGANREADVNTSQSALKKNTADLGSQASPSSKAPRMSQDPSLPAVSGPKRRKRYQRGTLYLDDRKRGRPSVWTYRYTDRVDGRRLRARVGTIEEYPDEVEALLARAHLEMLANTENPLSNATVRGLSNRFIEEVLQPSLKVPLGGEVDEDADLEYSTASNYKSALRCHILPRWENYAVRDFEKPEIRYSIKQWLRSLKRSKGNPNGLAPGSVGQVYAAMRVLFNFAVHWGYLKSNPFSDKMVRPPRGFTKRSKKPTQLNPAEFLLLMSKLDILENLAVNFDGWLGSRVSEPFGVKWEDLNLESGVVRFERGYVQGRFSRLKTEASRGEFPLPEEVIELLRRWRALTPYNRPTDYVFASPDNKGKRPFSPRTLMNHIQPVARALGLPHIGWHTFRHSFSRWAKNAGVELDGSKTLLRHQTAKMALETYGGAELASTRKLQARVIRHVKKEASKSKLAQDGSYLRPKTG